MAPTYKCIFCGKDFSRRQNVNRHVRTVHSNDSIPPMKAASNDVTMYTAPTVFQCTFEKCTLQYICKDSLTRHQRLKHGIIGGANPVMKYTIVTCQFCWKQMQSDELKAHVETTHTTNAKPDVETTRTTNVVPFVVFQPC